MLTQHFKKRFQSEKVSRGRRRKQKRKLLVQSLEDRRVLALLGVTPSFPIISANSLGSVDYSSTTNTFTADAVPLSIQPSFFGFPSNIDPPESFDLAFTTDSAGNLTGGVPGPDFVLTGEIDFDFDNVADATGTLLTGEVLAFGFADGAPTTTDSYDLRLEVTGGALATGGALSLGGTYPAYFDGFDIGLLINSENSTFTGSFDTDFTGGNKASIGPIETDTNTQPNAELGDFVWIDTNGNGLQDDGATGVNGVTVNLYEDVDGDGIAEPGGDDNGPIATTITATNAGEDGYYLFPELPAGDYFVEFDLSTIPSGFEVTTQDFGGDDSIDSDGDPITGLTVVTELVDNESDLTWDLGLIQAIDPAINIKKFVDKVVETSTMTTIDFDDLATGELVSTQYPGVVISAKSNSRPSAGNAAMIFDSADPTGNDYDLGTPNVAFGGPGQGSGGASNDTPLGNILIISEDGDASDPDDDAHGGHITFDFDSPVTINHLDLLDIDNNESGGSVLTVDTLSGTQTIAIPTQGNNSYQRLDIDVADVTRLKVEFVSSGAITELKYTSVTSEKQWFDAQVAPGVSFDAGETIEFSYHVTNPGDVQLSPVVVVDDNATPGNTADDFNPTPVLVGGFNQGDTDQDNRLDPGEEWIYTAEIVAAVEGQYTNIGKVTGTPVDDNDVVLADDVMDDDPANYTIVGIPGIDIEKLTNGHDADLPEDAVEIEAGETVTWTYLVTNTGSTTFDVSEVVVVDDNGTPLNTSDDFEPTLEASSDVGADGLLSPGEVWTFTASDVAQAVSASGQTEYFHFGGNSYLDGPNGNLRSFSSGGVSVDVTGFSRDSSGVYETAYVGAYNGGLGVTDRSEGDGSGSRHRLDNIGRLNYLVFQFSESVIVDAAFLDSVVHDSDLSIWIGDVASSGPLALSDAVLDGLMNETSMTNSSYSRWADFNAGGQSGNVLVLAAWVGDHTPEDRFKVRKLKVDTIVQGVYGNIGTVTAETATDSDPSHYTNPEPAPSGVIGDFVWNDLDRDGKQDSNEPGVQGVTVTLYDSAHNVIDTTTTGGQGEYEFTGLEGGDYKVGFSNLPNDFVFTRNRYNISDAIDSDANRETGKTHVITLEDHEIDRTVDAGIYEAAVDIMFEAEHFEWKDSPWTVKWDSAASGHKYIKAPNRTGSHYHSPPHGKKVMYQFDIEVSGTYELSALLRARNGHDNSLWVRVDGGDWIQWHTPVTGYQYQWHAVTDGWHHDSVAFGLDAGHHTLEIKVREDGLRLDKFMVSKLSTQTVVIDATDAASMDDGAWIEVDDDGNEFLVAAGGNHYASPPADSELTYDFTIDEAGVFDIYGLVSAGSGSENSFWIAVDDGPWIEWHLNVTGDSFEWQAVTDGWGQEAVRFDLSAGNHTLKIKVREDGTRLDKLVITNDANIDLNNV